MAAPSQGMLRGTWSRSSCSLSGRPRPCNLRQRASARASRSRSSSRSSGSSGASGASGVRSSIGHAFRSVPSSCAPLRVAGVRRGFRAAGIGRVPLQLRQVRGDRIVRPVRVVGPGQLPSRRLALPGGGPRGIVLVPAVVPRRQAQAVGPVGRAELLGEGLAQRGLDLRLVLLRAQLRLGRVLGACPLALDGEPVGALYANERKREAGELLGRDQLLALGELRRPRASDGCARLR